MAFKLTYKPYGAYAILIEWPPKINEEILNDILCFKSKLLGANIDTISSCNHAYHSLVVQYKVGNFNGILEVNRLKTIYESTDPLPKTTKTVWYIPVCYDVSFGIDIEKLSKIKKISVEALIRKHTMPEYLVYFIGFLPGFLYLGGLDSTLATERLSVPRLNVIKGAIAIGGSQTGIYPLDSPGGWHIIGNTPIHFFDSAKQEPCFVKPADRIKFFSISLSQYQDIKVLADAGVYQIKKELFNG